MSKNEASLKCRMPLGLARFRSWNWKDLMGIVAVVIFAYQLNRVTSLESRLVIQEDKFEKLERVVLKEVSRQRQLSKIPSVENNAESKKAVPDVIDESKKDSKEIELKPHSHYAIETKDGVPVNPGIN